MKGVKTKWVSFPALPKTDLPSEAMTPQSFEPVQTTPEPSVTALRALSKISNNEKETISSLDSHNKIIQERIDMMHQEVEENQEIINSLLDRIASFSCITEEQEALSHIPMKYMETEAIVGQISDDTAEEYLRNNPMILESLLNVGHSDKITDIARHLPKKARNKFLKHTISQLHRFSLVFSVFNKLSDIKSKPEFNIVLQKCLQTIYNSKQSFVFLRNLFTGALGTTLENGITIYIRDLQSLVPSTRETSIYTHPSQEESYSENTDKIFNPKDSTCIIVPISNVGNFMAIHTDNATVPYKNEDISIGDLLADLTDPLIKENQATESNNSRADKKNNLKDFEHELLLKDHLDTLLPFITTKLKSLINAEEIRLYFVSENKFILPTIKDGRIVEEKLEMKGITEYIRTTKKYLIEKLLSCDDCDEELDKWCMGKSFCGMPVDNSEGECIAVLCASAVEFYSFSEEDLETIMIISSGLALSVQRASENKEQEIFEIILQDFLKVPEAINECLLSKDAIFKELYKTLNIDSMVVYSLKEGGELNKIQSFGKEVFVGDFILNRMKEMQLVNTKNYKELEDFTPVDGYNYKSIFASFDERNGQKIGVFCTNPLNVTNQLDVMHDRIIKCFTNIYFNFIESDKEQDAVEISKSRYQALQTIFEISKNSSANPDIAQLLATIIKFIRFDGATVYLHDKTAHKLVPSDEAFPSISDTDPVLKELTSNKDVFVFKDLHESELNKLTENKVVIGFAVEVETFVIMFGKEIGDAIYTLQNFVPIIKAVANCYRLTDAKAKEIIQSNAYCELPQVEDLFDIHIQMSSMSVSDTMALGLAIFKRFNIDETISRKIMAKASKLSLGSWCRCVECMQFAAFLMNMINVAFKPSITFAVLVSSLFYVLTDANDATNAQFAYGEDPESAVKLFRAAEVSRQSNIDARDKQYWMCLRTCFDKAVEEKLDEIETISLENDEHAMLIAALICKISEFRRYFSHQSGNEITDHDAMTLSVLEMSVIPLFSKIVSQFPQLSPLNQNLEMTKKDLEEKEKKQQ